MSTRDVQRKLAAILSADVKGYSRLMADDDLATVRTINAYREVIAKLIREYKGRVVDSPGEKPGFFVEVLAKKLRLSPTIEENRVRLIGKAISRRLWLAFAETPFPSVPYHEVYNGWADENLFSGKIILLGFRYIDTDYFRVPYSPTDFTPHDKKDSYGMPGVFLFAHAINQVMNGYYHAEIHDEWTWPAGGKWYSFGRLESLLLLLIETIFTCLLLHLVQVMARKKNSIKLTYSMMAIATISLLVALALTPVLFGLANFLFASIFFIFFSTRRIFAK